MTTQGTSARKIGFYAGLILLAGIFISGGLLHFLVPGPYLRILPPILPWPKALLWISGAAEIAGGIGLLLPALRRIAAYGLMILLVLVFPANIYMAAAHVPFAGIAGESWAQWCRLPLQIPLILWAWYYAKHPRVAGKN
jgi:uncharacterized membrane protein